jgi:hemolysin activation/secretion protein
VLPNSERFSLGNSTIGRGFAPGNTTGDSGWGARLELRRDIAGREDAPVEAVELYAFYDYGRAYDRAAERDGMQWEELGSAGIGARIDVKPWLTLTPEIAQQTVGTATDTTDPDHETRFFIGAIARF